MKANLKRKCVGPQKIYTEIWLGKQIVAEIWPPANDYGKWSIDFGSPYTGSMDVYFPKDEEDGLRYVKEKVQKWFDEAGLKIKVDYTD